MSDVMMIIGCKPVGIGYVPIMDANPQTLVIRGSGLPRRRIDQGFRRCGRARSASA